MRPEAILRHLVVRENASTIKVSRAMGRSDGYLSSYIANQNIPSITVMSEIGDCLGYDLLLRRRSDGDEIVIEPPSTL